MDDVLNFSQCVDSHQDDGPKGAIEAIQDGGDIEGSIAKELQTMELSSTNHKKAYTFVRLDIPCGTCYAVSHLFVGSASYDVLINILRQCRSFARRLL